MEPQNTERLHKVAWNGHYASGISRLCLLHALVWQSFSKFDSYCTSAGACTFATVLNAGTVVPHHTLLVFMGVSVMGVLFLWRCAAAKSMPANWMLPMGFLISSTPSARMTQAHVSQLGH